MGQLGGLCKGQVSHPKKDLGLGSKKVTCKGQCLHSKKDTGFGPKKVTRASQPYDPTWPTYTPGGSILSNTFVGPIVELQPRSEVEGRTNAGGSGLWVAAMMTSEFQFILELAKTLFTTISAVGVCSSASSLCEKLLVR